MSPEYYSNIFRQYSTFMSNSSSINKIFRVASGPNDNDYNWTETLMKNIPLNPIEGISLHHYSIINWDNMGSAINFNEQQFLQF
jgi:alpha-N-arabinofuranosidase